MRVIMEYYSDCTFFLNYKPKLSWNEKLPKRQTSLQRLLLLKFSGNFCFSGVSLELK